MAKKTVEPLKDRLPPHSLEAEQGVLGCILLSPTDTMMYLTPRFPGPEVFYDLRHRKVYDLLAVMHDGREQIDLITVQQRLRDQNKLNAIGGLAYLASLPDTVPSAANIEYYAKIVFDKYRLRTMIQGCTEVIGRCYDDEKEAVSNLEAMQRDLSRLCTITSGQGNWQIKEAVRCAIKHMERDIETGGALTGLSTGFSDLDRKTRGLQPGDIIVIAARPSMGKSSLVANIADHVAVDCQIPVGIFSLEMNKEMVVRRMISARAEVNLFDFGQDLLAREEMSKLTKAAGQIADAPLCIDDSRDHDDVQIRANMRRMVHEHGIKLGIIDYLQLLNARKRFDSRAQEVAEISKRLKAIAGELNIPIIVCAQLNREVDKEKGQRPRISHLRESGAIEQDADVIGLLYATNPADEEQQTRGKIPSALYIGKQRNGPTGTIHLEFLKTIMRFQKPGIDDADVPRDVPPDPRFKD